MSDRDHAIAMLETARGDLAALQGMQHPALSDHDFFSDAVFGFHAQQAVEKTLKAWLSLKGVRYPHTHDLMALLDALADSGENVAALLDLVDLNLFAVQYRYETLEEEEEKMDRDQLQDRIQHVFNHVQQLIKA